MDASLVVENHVENTSVMASLEAMTVFKIYPEYEAETLPPPRRVECFFGSQEQGSVKNAKLDTFYGDVDGYY